MKMKIKEAETYACAGLINSILKKMKITLKEKEIYHVLCE